MTYQSRESSITIIIVEDENLIRMIAVEYFVEQGFEVLEAGNAGEAIELLLREAPRLHVLFTDVNMPGPMTGVALAHHVRRHWPWIGLLIASAEPIPSAADLPDGSAFVSKPYHLEQIVRQARDLAHAA